MRTDGDGDSEDFPDAVRGNASIDCYDAGHMMYVRPPSMQKFKNDLATFVDANAR